MALFRRMTLSLIAALALIFCTQCFAQTITGKGKLGGGTTGTGGTSTAGGTSNSTAGGGSGSGPSQTGGGGSTTGGTGGTGSTGGTGGTGGGGPSQTGGGGGTTTGNYSCPADTGNLTIVLPTFPDPMEEIKVYSPFVLSTTTSFALTPQQVWDAQGLPVGLIIENAGGTSTTVFGETFFIGGTWQISGTVSAGESLNGPFDVDICVTDYGAATPSSTNASVVLNVIPPVVPCALNIDTTSLPTAKVGEYFGYQLDASCGTEPYVWSAIGLPLGLSLDSAGMISGTPDSSSASLTPYSVAIIVTESSSSLSTLSITLDLVVLPADLVVLTSNLPQAVVGKEYIVGLQATGGLIPYIWSASSNLPAGLDVAQNPVSAVWEITGTPTSNDIGSHFIDLTVIDAFVPSSSVSKNNLFLSVVEEGNEKLSITNTYLPSAVEGETYAALTLTVSGGSAPFFWGNSIGLPPGLSVIDTGDGNSRIMGTPLVGTDGMYLVQLEVSDSSIPSLIMNATLVLVVDPEASSDDTGLSSPGVGDSDRFLSPSSGACSLHPDTHNEMLILLFHLALLSLVGRHLSTTKPIQ